MTQKYDQVSLAYLLRQSGDQDFFVMTPSGEFAVDKENLIGQPEGYIPLTVGGFANAAMITGHRFADKEKPTNQDSESSPSIFDYHTFKTDGSETDPNYRDGLRSALATQIEDQSKGNR